MLSQGRSQCLPWCLALVSGPRVERDRCSAKEEVNAFLGALRQRPPPEWRGTGAQPRKKSTPSLVPCVSAHPQSGEGQVLSQGRSQRLPLCLASVPAPRVERVRCSAKEEVNAFLGALRQCPTPEWRGTGAQPRKKSTPSLVPCVSVRPQSGEGQVLSQGRSQRFPWCLASVPAPRVESDRCSAKEEVNAFLGALRQCSPSEWRGTGAQPRKKSMPSLVPCVSAHPQSGEGQVLSQGRSQRLPWCLASVPAPRVESDKCSAKEEVNAFLGALRQCPPPEWRGTDVQPRKKSTPSLVLCVSACPQNGEGQVLSQGRSQHLPWCLASVPALRVESDRCSAKEEVNAFLGALRQCPPPEWRGTGAQPRKKSTPSLVLCVSARPQSGEGQVLSQGRSQRLPWCLASVPALRVERDRCSAKEEVNAFLGALRQCPPPEWRGTGAQPRKKSTPSLVLCVSARPQSGEGQVLSQGRSQRLPWCLASVPALRVERDRCSAKEEVNAFLGALRQCPPPEWRGTGAQPRKKSTPSLVPCVSARPQSGEGQMFSQGRSQRLPWCLVSVPAPRVERDRCSAKEEAHIENKY